MGTWSHVWDHSDMAQKWTTQSRYWIDLANKRTPLGWNGCRKALVDPQWYGSMVDVNQGVHMFGSVWYAGTKSSRDLKQTRNDGPYTFNHQSWRSRKLRARVWLVAATRLQAHTLLSSCVPRVICHLFWWMMHTSLLLIPMRKFSFHLATFVTRSS
jgi:hypothetical protein